MDVWNARWEPLMWTRDAHGVLAKVVHAKRRTEPNLIHATLAPSDFLAVRKGKARVYAALAGDALRFDQA